MADDAGHKAMLYFLETLMNSGSPLTISQLAGRFGGRNFTPEMRQACGGNEAGLKKFLLKYPSLFIVNGNLVSLNDGTVSLGKNFRESSPSSSLGLSLPDVSVETEAVQYFRNKMTKRGDTWMPVKSLAGHLSQASFEIRECVGPQNEFRDWILRHPLIFDIRGEMVGLKDNVKYSAVNPNSEPLEDMGSHNVRFSLTEKEMMYSSTHTPKLKRRPKSLEMPPVLHEPITPPSPSPAKLTASVAKAGPITMTANEYKAVMFIKNIIEKKGDMRLNGLTGHFTHAPESLRNTIGWSKPELERFIYRHSNIFLLDEDEMVSVIKNARLNVIITGSRPPPSSPRPTMAAHQGRVYHIAKLWGIIDLGKHEHVFIDRSIFGRHLDDLNKLMSVGEMVCFDAIPAPKGSRARWRAVRVWKEHESIEDLIDKVVTRLNLPIDGTVHEPQSPMFSNIDDEIKTMIPELNDSNIVPPSPTVNVGGLKYSFHDAAPSGAGVVPVWNFKHAELAGLRDVDDMYFSDDQEDEVPSLSMVAERYYMNRSVLDDSQHQEKSKFGASKVHSDAQIMNGNGNLESRTTAEGKNEKSESMSKKTCNAGCQTIVTGDVLATQLFHEEF